MLEWLCELRKAAAEQLCMDNISTGLDDRVERFVDIGFIGVSVNIPVISLSSFRIFFSYVDFSRLIR